MPTSSLVAVALGCVMNCHCTAVPLPGSYVATATKACRTDPAAVAAFVATCIEHCQASPLAALHDGGDSLQPRATPAPTVELRPYNDGAAR